MHGHQYLATTGEVERLKLRFKREAKQLNAIADFLEALETLRKVHQVVIDGNQRLADHLYYAGAVTAKEREEVITAHRATHRTIEQREAELAQAGSVYQSPNKNTHP